VELGRLVVVFCVVVLTCSVGADFCVLTLKLQLEKTNGIAKAINRKKYFFMTYNFAWWVKLLNGVYILWRDALLALATTISACRQSSRFSCWPHIVFRKGKPDNPRFTQKAEAIPKSTAPHGQIS
jgi:hypothetical protein